MESQVKTAVDALELTWDVRDTLYESEHSFPEFMRAVFKHPLVQRMNFIKQLGLCFLAFPSATHTRLEHSIGVAITLDKWLDKITVIDQAADEEAAVPKKPQVSPRGRYLICLAGLLHDVGHLWFSHLFDHVAEKYLPKELADHEPRSVELTRIIMTEVGGFSIAEIEAVQNMIMGRRCDAHASGVPFWAYLLVASLIDADKMDYLRRDLERAIGPGKCALQVDRIMSHSSIFIKEGETKDDLAEACMVFRSSSNVFGASEIEQVFTTRFHNYAIYRHHSILPAELGVIEMMPAVTELLKKLQSTSSSHPWWAQLTDAAFFALAPLAAPQQYARWLAREYSWKPVGYPRSYRTTNKQSFSLTTNTASETKTEDDDHKTVVTSRGFHSKGIDVTKNLLFYHKSQPTHLRSLPEMEGDSLLERVIFERIEYEFVKKT